MFFSELSVGSNFERADVFAVAMDMSHGDKEKAKEICRKTPSTKLNEKAQGNTKGYNGKIFSTLGNEEVVQL